MNSSNKKKISLLYAVPGHNLLEESGPTRNVLSVAKALSRQVNVTVAFRRIISPLENYPFQIVEFDPDFPVPTHPLDDSAIRATSLHNFIYYLVKLKHFVRQTHAKFDIVLEKSWILSGLLATAYHKYGVSGILVENIVRICNTPVRSLPTLLGLIQFYFAQYSIGLSLRNVSAVIAETESLKRQIQHRWKIPDSKVRIVDLGVDRNLFKPLDKRTARKQLEVSETATIMLYVGVIDSTHDISQVLEALTYVEVNRLELHVVGNGKLMKRYQCIAQKIANKVVFHGYVPHAMIPVYISAADACLAIYNLDNFSEADVPYSMLKVHEYLSCGRPVIGVQCKRLRELIEPGQTGILIDSTIDAWKNFLLNFPSSAELNSMMTNVQESYVHRSWEQTANGYLRLCSEILAV